MLTLKIISGDVEPIPQIYSKELKNLVTICLNVDQDKRPTINDILSKKKIFYLELNLIKNRIKTYLNELEFNDEFSHTIIHNYVILNINLESFERIPAAKSKLYQDRN